jgi:hypothetical protein
MYPDIFKPGKMLSWGGKVGSFAKAVLGQPWYKAEPLANVIKGIVEEFRPVEDLDPDKRNTCLLPHGANPEAFPCKM